MSPQLIKIKQFFPGKPVEDISRFTRRQLAALDISIPQGASVAVAVGSRGIANITQIVSVVIEFLKNLGAQPFIIPAMGSHGGATANGQREILSSLGISEERCGVPVRSSMEVIELDNQGLKNRLFMDKLAYKAGGIVLINRVKPHTDYHGHYESGLVKMCVLGLGKHQGALEIHRFGVAGLKRLLPLTAARVLSTQKILFGLAIVENAMDETLAVYGLKSEEILAREPEILELARINMPRLPVEKVDILLVDEMGKDISGTGLDTNIIGRMMVKGQKEPRFPRIQYVIVDDLTEGSHGNAAGVGLADIITRKLSQKINMRSTYENIFTAGFLLRGKIPLVVDNIREAVNVACRALAKHDEGDLKIIRIRNTLQLREMYVSANIYKQIKDRVETASEPVPIFDDAGYLLPF